MTPRPPRRVLFLAELPGRREVLLETLQHAGLQPDLVEDFAASTTREIGLTVGPVEAGAPTLPDGDTALVPEAVLRGSASVRPAAEGAQLTPGKPSYAVFGTP